MVQELDHGVNPATHVGQYPKRNIQPSEIMSFKIKVPTFENKGTRIETITTAYYFMYYSRIWTSCPRCDIIHRLLAIRCNHKVLDFPLQTPEWIAQGINKLIHTKNITVRVVLLENKWIFLLRGINSTALVTEFINLWILVREVKLSPLAKDPIMA